MTTYPPRVGRVFGRLTVKRRDQSREKSGAQKMYLCVCSCGNECHASWNALAYGSKKSCGCLAAERAATYKYTKGERRHELFQTWRTMVRRCHSPKLPKYKAYGAKGIVVCDAWREDFWQFVKDVGERPSSQHSLDRINNEGNYEPGNVRWATSLEQQTNRTSQRAPYVVTIGGKTKTLYSLCKASGVSRDAVVKDIRRGVPADEAFVAALLRKKLYAAHGPQAAEDYESCYQQAKDWLSKQ